MEPIDVSSELKKYNRAQIEEIKKTCTTQEEIIEWISKNSKSFRERYDKSLESTQNPSS
jgi:hypothetical protein